MYPTQADRENDPDKTDDAQLAAMIQRAKEDAMVLFDAGPKKWGSDKILIPLFMRRSYVHVRAMLQELGKMTSVPTEFMTAKQIHGDVSKLLSYFGKRKENPLRD